MDLPNRFVDDASLLVSSYTTNLWIDGCISLPAVFSSTGSVAKSPLVATRTLEADPFLAALAAAFFFLAAWTAAFFFLASFFSLTVSILVE